MNSIFKFYYSLWFLFAVSAIGLLAHFSATRGKPKKFGAGFRAAAILSRAGLILLVIACGLGTLINCLIMATFHRVEGPRPTLNGQLYLQVANADEYALIRWINNHVKGSARILEAQGDSYREFTRIVMHTGLSTVLGWEHHVKQRGTAENDVQRRKSDIRNIYSTPDAKTADALLGRYGVTLIVVSKVERDNYPAAGLEKFANHPEIFPVLFKLGDTVLYTRARSLVSFSESGHLDLQWKYR